MKKKRFTVDRVIIIIILILWIVSCVLLWLHNKSKIKEVESEASAQVSALQQQLATNVKYAYLANKDITIGETINELNVEYRQIISDLDQAYYIDPSSFGNVAIVPISMGMPLTVGMVESPTQLSVREIECNYIWMNTNLKENDFVDIRILYPNGEDQVVIPKTQLKNLNLLASNVFLWLEEHEILAINAAVVDAALHGGKIYTTKYIKPTLQEASIVNYQPNEAVINLMRTSPNIVQDSIDYLSAEIRASLEERLEVWESDEENEVTDMTTPVVDATIITSGSDSVDLNSDAVNTESDLVPEEPDVYE